MLPKSVGVGAALCPLALWHALACAGEPHRAEQRLDIPLEAQVATVRCFDDEVVAVTFKNVQVWQNRILNRASGF